MTLLQCIAGAAICQKSWESRFVTAEPGALRAPAPEAGVRAVGVVGGALTEIYHGLSS